MSPSLSVSVIWFAIMVPASTVEPGKCIPIFQSREKSGDFEHIGKVREFYPKYWKSDGILPKLLEK